MGYRSDICLLLNRPGVMSLKAKLASKETSDKIRSEVEYLLSHAVKHLVDAESGAECWHWTDLKWYDCDPEYYPEVDFIEKLMAELDEEDYRFMRVGEDYDDLEVKGCYLDDPFGLTLRREIMLDC